MKFYEFVLAHTVFRLFDIIYKYKTIDEKEELESVKIFEEITDKGSWVYNEIKESLEFIPPEKSNNFVTVEYEDNKCIIILSDKPYSTDSSLYDYPWEAEDSCLWEAEYNREKGIEVIIKREIPMLIADDDIACPYCKNSQPPSSWVKNTFKQEMMQVPDKIKLGLNDVKKSYLWCPICNCQVKKYDVLRKGDEWKEGFLSDKMPLTHSPLQHKRQLEIEHPKAKQYGWENSLSNKLRNGKQNILNPFSLPKNEKHSGLMVKVINRISTRDKEIHKTKWVKVSEGISDDYIIPDHIETSYNYSNDYLKYIPKRYKNYYPIKYCPINKLISDSFRYKCGGSILEEHKKKYHSGVELPVIRITENYELRNNYSLVEFAYDMGLTHVPVIVIGNIITKKEVEKELSDTIKIKNMTLKGSDKMLFKEIIDMRGLGEKDIKLVRHVVNGDYIKRIIENGDFELYQSYQKQNIFRDCDYIVTFTNLEGSKSLLKGLYKVNGIDEVNELPESIKSIKEYESWGEGPYYKYQLGRKDQFADLEERLIIDWGNSTRSWHQWILEKEVLEILPV